MKDAEALNEEPGDWNSVGYQGRCETGRDVTSFDQTIPFIFHFLTLAVRSCRIHNSFWVEPPQPE